MKIHTHHPLRSSFPTSSCKAGKLLTKGDIMHSVKKSREKAHLALLRLHRKPEHVRVGRAKMAKSEGVKGYHCVGLGFIPGNFEALKTRMRQENYTALVMGAIEVNLRGFVAA